MTDIGFAAERKNPLDGFVEVNKTIPIPKSAAKEITDFILTSYACYLIAQNSAPRKEAIAFAQSYFAIQMKKRNWKKQ